MKVFCFAIVTAILLAQNPLFSVEISNPVQFSRAVDARYNQLHSLKTDFVETYRGAGADRTESGTLWLKKPGKMRWEYRSPKEKLFLSDGKDAWFYLPDEKQARRSPVKNLDDLRSPLGLLLGKTKLEKELQGLSFAPDLPVLQPGNVILRGVPQGLGERFTSVLVEVTAEYRIARIVVDEVDGSSTEYRFSNPKENEVVPDQMFRFTPPAGVEVVEGGFSQ